MAHFEYYPPDDFLKKLNKLQSEEVLDEVLKAGGEVLLPYVVREVASIVKDGTGTLVKSIKLRRPQVDKEGNKSILVFPTGRDKRGVRNAAKFAYIEYGVEWPKYPKRKRYKRPFVRQVQKRAEPKVLEAMKRKMEEYT